MMKETILFFMFYASVAMLSLIACCYLLFRRANAIAPVRLRRWTAAFFAAIALCPMRAVSAVTIHSVSPSKRSWE